MAAGHPVNLKRIHAQRLREVYRSAGWPYQDTVEIELLAAGLLERVNSEQGSGQGPELVRVTQAGLVYLAGALAGITIRLGITRPAISMGLKRSGMLSPMKILDTFTELLYIVSFATPFFHARKGMDMDMQSGVGQ